MGNEMPLEYNYLTLDNTLWLFSIIDTAHGMGHTLTQPKTKLGKEMATAQISELLAKSVALASSIRAIDRYTEQGDIYRRCFDADFPQNLTPEEQILCSTVDSSNMCDVIAHLSVRRDNSGAGPQNCPIQRMLSNAQKTMWAAYHSLVDNPCTTILCTTRLRVYHRHPQSVDINSGSGVIGTKTVDHEMCPDSLVRKKRRLSTDVENGQSRPRGNSGGASDMELVTGGDSDENCASDSDTFSCSSQMFELD
jgi:hypothetical protein